MKKFDFIFVYEGKARELDNICLIAVKLEEMGYTVKFINSWYCVANEEEKKRYKCNVLIISAGYDTASIKYFLSHVSDCNFIVNLQWEQVATRETLANTDFRWFFKGAAKHIAHVAWGDWNYNNLKEIINIEPMNIALSGHTSLDLFRAQFNNFFISKDELFKKFKLNKYNKVSLFISSFTLVNQRKTFLEYAAQTQGIEDMVEISEKTQESLFSWFLRYLTDNPDEAIVYRPHPEEIDSEMLKQLASKVSNLHVISDLSIKPWIKHCDVIYTWISTSIAEIWASGQSCYILRPVKLPYEKDMVVYQDVDFITDYNSFIETTTNSEYSFPIKNEIMQHFYLFEDEANYIKVSNYLVNCLKNNRRLNKDVRKELFADIRYEKLEGSLYGTIMDFIAMNTPLPFTNFEQRRKTYAQRSEQKNKPVQPPDEHTLKKIKQNYATQDEIEEIKQRLKDLI